MDAQKRVIFQFFLNPEKIIEVFFFLMPTITKSYGI